MVSLRGVVSCQITILGSHTHSVSVQAAQLEETVVTSEKRAEGIQEVPISVSALAAEDLQALAGLGFCSPG